MNKEYKMSLELALCKEMGRMAFESGMKCIPASDKRVMSVIADNRRISDTRDILNAWIAGYTQANLEEKVI